MSLRRPPVGMEQSMGVPGLTLGGGLFILDDATCTLNATSTLFAGNTATTGRDVNGTFDNALRCLVQAGGGAVGVANNDANGNRVGVQARLCTTGTQRRLDGYPRAPGGECRPRCGIQPARSRSRPARRRLRPREGSPGRYRSL